MINIAICDDEKYILDKIKKLVFDFFHRKNVEITVSHFGSGEELLRHNKNIDILFLDIQMDGIDGMETARKMRSQNYKGYLIFITVLKEMVFQSFEVQLLLQHPGPVQHCLHWQGLSCRMKVSSYYLYLQSCLNFPHMAKPG